MKIAITTLNIHYSEEQINMAEKRSGMASASASARESEREEILKPDKARIIEYLSKIPGIGISKASAIYDAGFDTWEKLKSATKEQIDNIKGIGRSLADKLMAELKKLDLKKLQAELEQELKEAEEVVIAKLKRLPGLGYTKAKSIYDAGYKSTKQLKELTVEKLTEVAGIGKSLATKIVSNIEKLEREEELPPLVPPSAPTEEAVVKPKGATAFIKDTFGKLKSFLIRRAPRLKTGTEQQETTE